MPIEVEAIVDVLVTGAVVLVVEVVNTVVVVTDVVVLDPVVLGAVVAVLVVVEIAEMCESELQHRINVSTSANRDAIASKARVACARAVQ